MSIDSQLKSVFSRYSVLSSDLMVNRLSVPMKVYHDYVPDKLDTCQAVVQSTIRPQVN